MGAMLGGVAMGVLRAANEARALQTSSRLAPTPATDAVASTPPAQDESEPMDEDDEIVATASSDTAPSSTASLPTRRARATSNIGALDSAAYHVAPGRVTGYRDGRPIQITVTIVDGFPVEVHTAAAFERMRSAAARAGVRLRIRSGFRTMEHQRALYAAYRAGRGNLAALPGHSNHQSGRALDLDVRAPGVLRWLEAHAREFGFRRTVPTESWHWEYW